MKRNYRYLIITLLALVLLFASALPAMAEPAYGYTSNGFACIQEYKGNSGSNVTLTGSKIAIVGHTDANQNYTGTVHSSITIPGSVTVNGASYSVEAVGVVGYTSAYGGYGAKQWSGLNGLATVTINNGPKILGMNTFMYCKKLTTVTLPSSMTQICRNAFYGCTALTTVNMPTSVTSIGDSAFYGCTNLTIRYAGTSAQWANVSKGSTNTYNVVCLGDSQPGPTQGPSQPTLPPMYTTYAGYYTVKGTNGTLAINNGPGSGYTQLGSIPEGATVYISAATGYNGHGNSSGNWGQVSYGGVSGYCAMNFLTPGVADTSAPVIGTPVVSNLSHQGFTLSVQVTDNVGVTRVQFPTWTPDTSVNGSNQDDLVWHEASNGSDGVTWSCYISTSQHKNENNCRYWTDVYAYDEQGNVSTYKTVTTNVPPNDTTAPTIRSFNYTNASSSGFGLSAQFTDNVDITRVVYTVRSANGTQKVYDKLSSHSTSSSQSISTSDFGNRSGENYICVLTVYDAAGNSSSSTITVPVPPADTTSPVFRYSSIGLGIDKNNNEPLLGIVCSVADDSGLKGIKVRYAIWTEPDGQDDLDPTWMDTSTETTIVDESVYDDGTKAKIFRRSQYLSAHNLQTGCKYIVHIYAYDAAGNYSVCPLSIYVPKYATVPVIQSFGMDGAGTDIDTFGITWAINDTDDTETVYSQCIIQKDPHLDYVSKDIYYIGNKRYGTGKVFHEDIVLPPGDYFVHVYAYSDESNESNATVANEYITVKESTAPERGTLITFNESGHKLYKLFQKEGITFQGAWHIGADDPGRFVQITNESEQAAVEALVAQSNINAWIGVHDFSKNYTIQLIELAPDTYLRSTFKRIQYANWDSGEPDAIMDKCKCVLITPEGYWRAVTNNHTDSNSGYILEYSPTAIEATMRVSTFTPDRPPRAEDCEVQLTFEDGTELLTDDFEISLSGTDLGAQTLTVTYGELTAECLVTFVADWSGADFTLPASLTRIETEAFMGGSMQSVRLPDGLETIGARAFADCAQLNRVYVPESVEAISDSAFDNCPADMIVYGYRGIEAASFAARKGYTFVQLPDDNG